MEDVVILGAGGHAQVVADILLRARDAGEQVNPIGYLDDNPDLRDNRPLGLPVLGVIADLSRVAHDAVIAGIGDNRTRQSLFDRLRKEGEHFAVARHPSAAIAPDAEIGPGTMICARVVVNPVSVIGENVILNTGSTIDHHNSIGDHCHIAPGVHLGGEVTIDEGTLVGIGATVMPRCSVGAWSVVGAAALVNKDLPEGVTAKGIPAVIDRTTSEKTD